jgi:glycosyltransferase involved in cell wall biosynthesis
MVLLNLSNLPWVPGRLKRNQAIFSTLLSDRERFSHGIFVNPPVIAEGIGRKYIAGPSLQEIERTDSIRVVQPVYSLSHWYVGGIRRSWASELTTALVGMLKGEPYVLWINSAGRLQTELAERLADNSVLCVFDASDDFTAWEGPEYPAQLRRVLAVSDVVTCVNEHVASTIEHSQKIVFRNCTDFSAFQREDNSFRLSPWFPKPEGAVYVGFTGGINETRADEPLLRLLFESFPQYQFLFVGYTDNPDFVQRLTRCPNVAFVPEIPYKQLPDLIRGFDVAIVPHQDNAVTRGNDLLKVLDYLACGVPVVSTRCSNVEEYAGALYVADSSERFIEQVKELVERRLHDPVPGYAIARSRDWASQVPTLAAQLFAPLPTTNASREVLSI